MFFSDKKIWIQFKEVKQEKCPVVSKEMLTNGKKNDPNQPPSLLVATAGNKFGRTLFKQLRKTGKTGNLVVSPISLTSTLAMLLPGAKGLTLSQVGITWKLLFVWWFVPRWRKSSLFPQWSRQWKAIGLFKNTLSERNSNHVTWFRCLLTQLKTNSNFTLETANKLYIRKDIRPQKKYLTKSDSECLPFWGTLRTWPRTSIPLQRWSILLTALMHQR